MENPNRRLAVVLLAALGGTLAFLPLRVGSTVPGGTLAQAETQSVGSSPTATPSSSDDEKIPTEYAAEILYSFFFGGSTGRIADKENGGQGDLELTLYSLKNAGYSIQSLVATVPDPIESGLSNQLDDKIDSIQRAALAAGYVLDRYKLPWPTPAEREGNEEEAKVDQSEPTNGPPKPAKRSEPGVILFRHFSEPRLLVVFLVGESPTSGIHKESLARSLQQLCELRPLLPADKPDNEAPIGVLGPTFSGSQTSLILGIRHWRAVEDQQCSLAKINMISGSATRIDPHKFKPSDRVDFKSTIIPDELALKKLFEWIQRSRLGLDKGDRVAVLSENTEYGELTELISRNTYSRPSQFSETLDLNFPIHISELQKAREHASAKVKSPESVSALLHNPNLPLASAASRQRRDLIPIYSESQANSLEIVLAQLLGAIQQQRIRCVIIAATNIEDTIFLARQVREASPTVTLISLNANVLFLHSEVNPQLQGMLVASTYPLYNTNQVWTNPFWGAQLRNQFPSDLAEGDYNAMLALLGDDVAMLDYGEPYDSYHQKPPLWLMVVGNGGMWPVAEIPVDDLTDSIHPRASELGSDPAKFTWPGWPVTVRLMFLLFALLILTVTFLVLHVVAYAKPNLLPALVEQYFAAGSAFENLRLRRRLHQAAVVLVLFSAVIVVLPVVLYPFYADASLPANYALLILRASSIGSRVSPLAPLLLAMGAGLALLLGELRRTRLLESRQLFTPFLSFGTPSFSGVTDLEARLRDALRGVAIESPMWWLAMPSLAGAYTWLYWRDSGFPIDGPAFAWLFFMVSLLAYLGIAGASYQLIAVWLSARRLLRRLYWHPSRPGYEKFRGELASGDAGVDLLSSTPTLTALEVGLAQVRRLISFSADRPVAAGQVDQEVCTIRKLLSEGLEKAEQTLEAALVAFGQSHWRDEIRLKRETEEQMSRLSAAVARVYEPQWRGTAADMDKARAVDKSEAKRTPPLAWGELYVASRVVDLLRQLMPQLQTLSYCATAATLLMLFAVSSYPFPMADNLLWFSWVIVAITAGAIVWMFISANKDRVTSLISGTNPGSVNWNSTLVAQIGTHALIPLVVLLGAAFPERLSRLVSWFGQILGGGH
jgi:hypothetical protein